MSMDLPEYFHNILRSLVISLQLENCQVARVSIHFHSVYFFLYRRAEFFGCFHSLLFHYEG